MTERTIEGLRQAGMLIAGFGILVAVVGIVRLASIYGEAARGVETVATIDRAWSYGSLLSPNATLQLRWTDAAGNARQARGVSVSQALRDKLIQDQRLTRTTLRIRYRPEQADGPVVVVENVGPEIATARSLAVKGFGVVTLGSLMVLAGLIAAMRRAGAAS